MGIGGQCPYIRFNDDKEVIMKLDGKTIAVIGGTGFIGRMIVEALAVKGARIKVLARNPDRAKFLKPMGQVGQISIHGGNALDDASLVAVMEGADAVSTRSAFSRKAAVSVLPAAGGAPRSHRPARQDPRDQPGGADFRHRCKRAIKYQIRCKQRGREDNLKAAFPRATMLRPSLEVGEGDRFSTALPGWRCWPRAAGDRRWQKQGQPVYAGDVAEAVVAVLEQDKTAGRTYELGGPCDDFP